MNNGVQNVEDMAKAIKDSLVDSKEVKMISPDFIDCVIDNLRNSGYIVNHDVDTYSVVITKGS